MDARDIQREGSSLTRQAGAAKAALPREAFSAWSINAAELVDGPEIGYVDNANGCQDRQRGPSLCGGYCR